MATHRVDRQYIELLHRLIGVADHSRDARVEVLDALRFTRRQVWFSRTRARLFESVEDIADPFFFIALTVVVGVVDMEAASLVFVAAASLLAYVRWIRLQRSSNVRDAMARKDAANKMIIDHADLLFPYVGNVFGLEARYAAHQLSDAERATVDMYVFTEIDNLEFVFDKSRAGLIEDEFVLRAIKIFVTRSENSGFFNVASRLVVDGRYNEDFARASVYLLQVSQFDPLNEATR